MTLPDFVDGVEVLWRPGCPFCSRLRRGLHRRGIEVVETDIWQDRAAAARIRAVTGGDEIGVIVKSCGLGVVRRPRTLGCRAKVPG